MKNLILGIVIISIIMVGCKPKELTTSEKYQKAVSAVNASTERCDTIFLKYRFGMSKTDYNKHTNSMVKGKKLIKLNGEYYYTFHFNYLLEKDVRAILVPKFYEDALSKLTLIFEKEPLLGVSTQLMNLFKIYKSKYDYKERFSFEKGSDDLFEHRYIRKNQSVIISSVNSIATVEYVDLIAEFNRKQKRSSKFNAHSADI